MTKLEEEKDYNPKTWFICDSCDNKWPKSEGYYQCQSCHATLCCSKCRNDHIWSHEPEYKMKYD